MEEVNYDELNPGIRQCVRWLREHGFNTSSSGDGKTHECTCDPDHAFVTMLVDPNQMVAEADRLASLLQERLGIELTGLDEDGSGTEVSAMYWPSTTAILVLDGVDDTFSSWRDWEKTVVPV